MTLLRLILCLGFFVPVCVLMGLAGPWPQVTVFVGLVLGLLLGFGFSGALPACVVRALFGPVEDRHG